MKLRERDIETVARAVEADAGQTQSGGTQRGGKIRLDPDVLAAPRATGRGWQTRVNQILRERFAL